MVSQASGSLLEPVLSPLHRSRDGARHLLFPLLSYIRLSLIFSPCFSKRSWFQPLLFGFWFSAHALKTLNSAHFKEAKNEGPWNRMALAFFPFNQNDNLSSPVASDRQGLRGTVCTCGDGRRWGEAWPRCGSSVRLPATAPAWSPSGQSILVALRSYLEWDL